MTASLTYTGSLLVIIDEADDDHTKYTYLLTLFSRKLRRLDIFLRKIFFITKADHADIVAQLGFLVSDLTSHANSWVFVTTTKSSNDHVMQQALNDLHGQISNGYVQNKRVFLLRNKSFHEDMRLLMEHLTVSRNRFTLLYQSEAEMSVAVEAFTKLKEGLGN